MKSNRLVISIFALFILISSSFILNAYDYKIKVVGNKRISERTIKVIAGFSEEFTLSESSINQALIKLNDSGLFSDVKIDWKTDSIAIELIENPIISQIFFEGNKLISREDLVSLVQSKPRNAYSKATVLSDVNNLVSFYKSKGRFNSVIEPQLINNIDNSIELIFNISEGDLLEVSDIIFIGNKNFSDKKLSSVIPSRKKGLFSFITDSDNFSETLLKKDQAALERFYKSNGFVDVRITSSLGVLSHNQTEVNLVYKVIEGRQYFVGKTDFDVSELNLGVQDYRSYIPILTGDVYNKTKIDLLISEVEKKVIFSGLPLAKVRLNVKKSTQTGIIDLRLVFQNNQKLFVERIEIRGNSQTLDRVIRREFNIVEGDAFNALMLRKTEERLRASGFFEKVNIRVKSGKSTQKAIVIVDVVEAPTGSLNFGVGYSTDTSVTGSLALTERNLLGKGQKLNLNLSVSENSQTLNFGFTEPSFLNRDVSAGENLNLKKVDPSESTYTSNSVSISPSLGFRVGPNSRMLVSYKIENLSINAQDSSSSVLRGDNGDYIDSSISSSLVVDKRNSIIEPTDGYIVRFSGDLSGLGGNIGLVKSSIRTKFYKGVLNDLVVFSAELEGGNLSSFRGFSRVTDRFKLGGRNFRGFQFGEIGPRDISGDALGGEKYIMSRFEANFPLGLPKELGLYGGVFSELGSLWSLKAEKDSMQSILYSDNFLRRSAGVSLYWSTPIGPLQFNWSKPIEYIDGADITENFSLNLATRF